jgi:hypothetical protein
MSVPVKTPPRPFLGSILIRTFLVWAFVRVALSATVRVVPASGADVEAHPVTGFGIIAMVVAVIVLDIHRRDEATFLRALGVGPISMMIPTVTFCGALEAARLFVA